ncbi:MAG: glycosyltransferase family 2 protein [Actinomycetota bacterium]
MAPDLLSVVIPTYNRAASLDALLRSLADQAGPGPFEVLVVDDGSTDETPRIAERWSDGPLPFEYVRLEHRGPAGVRNEGLRRARGEVVAFIDDDERADPAFVAGHRAAHAEHPRPDQGVLGFVDWAPEVRITRFIRWLDRSGLQFNYPFLSPGRITPVYGAFVTANLSVKRAFLVEGDLLFDERFPYPAFEDTELGWRLEQAGYELHYHPEILALHARQFSLKEFARRMERVGESAPIFKESRPDFPFEEGYFRRGPLGWKAWAVRLGAPWLRAFGPDRLAGRYYDDVAHRAYSRGTRRGRASAADG